jgi:hypothetical protein
MCVVFATSSTVGSGQRLWKDAATVPSELETCRLGTADDGLDEKSSSSSSSAAHRFMK